MHYLLETTLIISFRLDYLSKKVKSDKMEYSEKNQCFNNELLA
jgi:hypothetical protein